MNQKFAFHETGIPGLVEIEAFNTDDNRGSFTKDYSKEIFEANDIQFDLAEVFYTTSKKGVIRGLHFQRVKEQAKLVRCVQGHIWDVVVDLRKDGPTFKKWLAFDLTGENHKELLVPKGCAHGFLVLEDAVVVYKCDEKFYLEYDDGISWNDANIGIEWPLEKVGGREQIILSEKDKGLQTFETFMNMYGEF